MEAKDQEILNVARKFAKRDKSFQMTDVQKRMGMSAETAEYKMKLQMVMQMLQAQEEEILVNEIRKEHEKYKL